MNAARHEGLLPEDLHRYRWHSKERRQSSVAWAVWVVHIERSAKCRALCGGSDDHLPKRPEDFRANRRLPPVPNEDNLGTASHTVTVDNRATIKVLIYPYYEYDPTVTEWGQCPKDNYIPLSRARLRRIVDRSPIANGVRLRTASQTKTALQKAIREKVSPNGAWFEDSGRRRLPISC